MSTRSILVVHLIATSLVILKFTTQSLPICLRKSARAWHLPKLLNLQLGFYLVLDCCQFLSSVAVFCGDPEDFRIPHRE